MQEMIRCAERSAEPRCQLEHVYSHVEITVADTGAAITPEFLPHVFERFRQADMTYTRAHGGLGLGLSIVRQLVELHGGTVRAESEGEGPSTTFTVSLPPLPVHTEPAGDRPRVHPAVAAVVASPSSARRSATACGCSSSMTSRTRASCSTPCSPPAAPR